MKLCIGCKTIRSKGSNWVNSTTIRANNAVLSCRAVETCHRFQFTSVYHHFVTGRLLIRCSATHRSSNSCVSHTRSPSLSLMHTIRLIIGKLNNPFMCCMRRYCFERSDNAIAVSEVSTHRLWSVANSGRTRRHHDIVLFAVSSVAYIRTNTQTNAEYLYFKPKCIHFCRKAVYSCGISDKVLAQFSETENKIILLWVESFHSQYIRINSE